MCRSSVLCYRVSLKPLVNSNSDQNKEFPPFFENAEHKSSHHDEEPIRRQLAATKQENTKKEGPLAH